MGAMVAWLHLLVGIVAAQEVSNNDSDRSLLNRRSSGHVKVGWWGSKHDAYKYSSFAFDDIKKKDIKKYGGDGIKFFYPAWKHFCKDDGACKLKDDYKKDWEKAVPDLKQQLKDGQIMGFTFGDEHICSQGKHGGK